VSARTVLNAALGAGFRLSIRAWKLHVESTPPPDPLDQLRQHKHATLELLADGPIQRAGAREMAKPRPAERISYVPVYSEGGWTVEVQRQ
jgi:hypothetical protein